MKRTSSIFRADLLLSLLIILSGLALFSCTTSGGESRRVEFKLEDSLSAYSKVKIALLDDKDTSRVLAVVFNDSLANPKNFPPYDLPDSIGDFRVRVQGFDSKGLLAFQSTVEVKGGAADKAEKLPPESLPALLAKLPGARLASLDVSAGTLVPPFDTSVFAYDLEVPFVVDSLSVNAVAADSQSSLTWGGKPIVTGAPSAAVRLEVGGAKIAVGVTPKGGALENHYVINVTRRSGEVNALAGIALSSGTLSPAFDPAHLDYVDSVENDQLFAQITAKPLDSNCIVIIGGDTAVGGVSKPFPLDPGSIVKAPVKVVSEDNFHEKEYSVTMIRKLSGDASLSSLGLSDGALVIPDFDPGVLQYKAVTASSQVSIMPVASQVGAVIEVDGKPVFSGGASQPIDVNVGLTPVIIVVTSPNGAHKNSYVLTLERSSPNALLQSLSLGGGVHFDSVFQKARLQYKAIVPRTTAGIALQYETADVGATVAVRVNGDSVPTGGVPPLGSADLALKVGLNLIKVEVTAPDKASKTLYTIALLRQPATIADLSSLTVTGGLKPFFSPAVFQYTDTIANFNAFATVQAAAVDSNATVVVRLKRRNVILKSAPLPKAAIPAPPRLSYVTIETDTLKAGKSLNLPMEVGDNLIEVTVIAEDGVTGKVYSAFVQRLPSANAHLFGLVLAPTGSSAPLSITPAFSQFIFKYVDTTFASYVTVKPTAFEVTARILVNGAAVASGGNSASITLVNGLNTITVDVTAPDKITTAKYQVQIEKKTLVIKQPPFTF